jgi:hypothetical protein
VISALILLSVVAVYSTITYNFGFIGLARSLAADALQGKDVTEVDQFAALLTWFGAWGLGAVAVPYLATYRTFRRQRLLAEAAALVHRTYDLDAFDIRRATSVMPSIPLPYRLEGKHWIFAYRLSSALEVPADRHIGIRIFLPIRKGAPMLVLFQPDPDKSPIALKNAPALLQAHLPN